MSRATTAIPIVRFRPAAAVLAASLVALPGCAMLDHHEPIVIPEGAQVVHVTVSDDEVTLEPATASAGDVYLVNEGPASTYSLVSSVPTAGAEPRGFTQADVDRIAAGDFQGTGMEGIDVTCDRAWSEAEHWRDCGENWRATLTEGLYIVMAGGEMPGEEPVMAVLEVTP